MPETIYSSASIIDRRMMLEDALAAALDRDDNLRVGWADGERMVWVPARGDGDVSYGFSLWDIACEMEARLK
ncbi:hypothetical protein RGUI_2749 [Rhodovulum sp. P5]|uniref:hypothetical protein n=1 Tax=Rhodovulum sp. P5 TaxID=1564506 RepID=UPI0009C1D84F|nr:hypothetical protein [Rhodovulum sp. P5]ARE40890.1 hypothetical protein RGUI_2749 [Rhodovulum sp. P5]